MSNARLPNTTQIFIDLAKISSPTFHEEQVAKELYRRLKKIGLTPTIDKEGNVLAKIKGDSSKEIFLVNAHMDTVQAQGGPQIEPHIDNEGWIRSKGDTILGADNKTAVAAILTAIENIYSQNLQNLCHPLEIVFTVSEESGNHGAHGLDYSKLRSRQGFVFDAGGRDFGDIIISSPFYTRFDIKISGKSAHASRPDLAVNVLPIVTKAINSIKLGKVSRNSLLNVGIVSVGEVGGPVNTIPGQIIVSGEIRSTDEKELIQISQDLSKQFTIQAKKVKAKLEIKFIRENDGYAFLKSDLFLKNTIKKLKDFGIKPKLINSWGCYEANIFAAHGIKMLNIADGSLDNHTPEERIKISDLERLAELVYELMID